MAILRLVQAKRRRRRKLKLARLRELYQKTTSHEKKEKILQKLAKISPTVTEKAFTAPIHQQA